jgi:hypothetical protein
MAKLTKAQAKAHAEACKILAQDRLTEDDRWIVLENWQESATHINSVAGAFFTPPGLARDFNIEVGGKSIIDLCAGMGTLALFAHWRGQWDGGLSRIVCVELNPDYAAVGRKLLPEAEWIEASIFDLPDLGHFDTAISNPPFGATKRTGSAPRFTGQDFEYHVIDIASDLAEAGTFIIPQMSAPFRYSGQPGFERREEDRYRRFRAQTGIELGPSCGIDGDYYRADWHGVAPTVEIVTADFAEARLLRAHSAAERAAGADLPLFDLAPVEEAA